MLDLFRKRGLSSIVYGVVIIATILVFVIQFRPNAGQKTASVNEACVAKVRGWCIDPKDHRAAYRILMPRDRSNAPMPERAKAMGLSRIALDGLIERELLVNEADRLGIKVTDDEVTDEIFRGFVRVSVPSDRPDLMRLIGGPDASGAVYFGFVDSKTKQFDMKIYERTIRNVVARSPTEFREEQSREILAAKMRDLIRAPVRVSEPEALEMYVASKSSATIRYAEVSQKWAARWFAKITPADVDAWMKQPGNDKLVDDQLKLHKEDDTPKANHIRHILIKTPPTASDADVEAAAQKLSAAKARIDAGESFAVVARDVSDDTGSAMHGGDVGDKTDPFVAPFRKAADALKPGEMTKTAIQTQFGLHLIMKDDPSKAGAGLDDRLKRDYARDLARKGKALEAARETAAKIEADVKGGKSLDDAATAAIASAPKGSIPVMDITRPAPETSEAGDAGASEAADAGAAAATDAGGAKAAKGAQAKTAAATPKVLTPDNDPDRPQVSTSNPFDKAGDPIPGLPPEAEQKVVAWAFDAKVGDASPEPIRGKDGIFVAQLKDRKTASKEDFDKERDAFMRTLLLAKQAEALSVYVRRLRDAAKDSIKIDETYLIDAKAGADGGAPAPIDEEEEGP